jgi:crotonobetainyl-CoA:carnitine CoA-transferase CaiB-like acyl-CoA transferase
LFARANGRGGQHLELSMMDAVVSFLWADSAANEVLLDADGSQPSSFVAGFKPMRFVDGWGITTPTSDHDFAGMCIALGIDGHDDPRVATIGERMQHRELTASLVQQCYLRARDLTMAEASARFDAQRVPYAMIVSSAQLPDDPHAIATGLFETYEHHVVGRVRHPRHPTRFTETPATLTRASPALGEHTNEILDELGLGGRTADLRAAGVVS